MSTWSAADVPDQTGRTAVITGASSGIGMAAAEVLAAHGARVVLTARNAERGAAALARVESAATSAAPALVMLDLADLSTVNAGVSDIRSLSDDRIDLLVNNAGIMAPPLEYSAQGIESQWATNVIGPAALTWGLLPALVTTAASRVVMVSSLAHFGGRFTADRIDADVTGLDYNRWGIYGRTKLANLLFAREVEKHFRRAGAATLAASAHPGFSSTNVASTSVERYPEAVQRAAVLAYGAVGQPAAIGALPILFAATAPGVRGAQYFGPGDLFETRGAPAKAARSGAARRNDLGALVLRICEELTGVARPAS